MPVKRVLRADRRRAIPTQFSWIDQRLVRDDLITRYSTTALALYLVLVTVADSEGLSYYADATLSRLLLLQPDQLRLGRAELIRGELIAYERPLYQVLSLQPPAPPRMCGIQSVQALLSRSSRPPR
jgi:hypothetical protein